MKIEMLLLLLVVAVVAFKDEIFGRAPAAPPVRDPYQPSAPPIQHPPPSPAYRPNAVDAVIYGIGVAGSAINSYVNRAPTPPKPPLVIYGPNEDQLFPY